jgi:condensin complex subunit 3
MLSKLHLSVSSPDPGLLRTVLELVAEAIESKVASDATSRNALTKMQTTLLKLMHDIATAERGGHGGEETVIEDATVVQRTDVDITAQSVTGAEAREEEEEEATEVEIDAESDPVNAQLRRELESTRIEDPDAEGTRMDIDEEMEDYDFSGMADDKDVQALMDSMADDDDDLIE